MHIHDDLQDVIARDTAVVTSSQQHFTTTSLSPAVRASTAFHTNLSRRFGSYRLMIRDGRSVQQNLERRLSALTDGGGQQKNNAGFKLETPVSHYHMTVWWSRENRFLTYVATAVSIYDPYSCKKFRNYSILFIFFILLIIKWMKLSCTIYIDMYRYS